MCQESSWITKCRAPASWSLIIFVCPLLLQWLFQRFPLTVAAKWAHLKVTDWEYMFKYIYKCIHRFPFHLSFSLQLTDVKTTLATETPTDIIILKKIEVLLTFIPHLSQNSTHFLPACSPSCLAWQGTLIKQVILFFDHLLVIPAEVFPAPQCSHLGLSWQLTRKASDPNQALWHNQYAPHKTLCSLVACTALCLPGKFRVWSILQSYQSLRHSHWWGRGHHGSGLHFKIYLFQPTLCCICVHFLRIFMWLNSVCINIHRKWTSELHIYLQKPPFTFAPLGIHS